MSSEKDKDKESDDRNGRDKDGDENNNRDEEEDKEKEKEKEREYTNEKNEVRGHRIPTYHKHSHNHTKVRIHVGNTLTNDTHTHAHRGKSMRRTHSVHTQPSYTSTHLRELTRGENKNENENERINEGMNSSTGTYAIESHHKYIASRTNESDTNTYTYDYTTALTQHRNRVFMWHKDTEITPFDARIQSAALFGHVKITTEGMDGTVTV